MLPSFIGVRCALRIAHVPKAAVPHGARRMSATARVRGVLFDLDGTLIDSATGIAEALNRTLAELGCAREPEATIRTWIGDGARELLQRALAHAGRHARDEAAFAQAHARLMQHYQASLPLQARPFPGAGELLQRLRAAGIGVALCTNKPERFIAPLLDALGWQAAFDAVAGGDTLPQRKPDPAPLLHCAQALGVPHGQCVMVGDSRTDADAAHAAGMPLLLVRFGYARGFALDDAGALAVIDALPQVADAVGCESARTA